MRTQNATSKTMWKFRTKKPKIKRRCKILLKIYLLVVRLKSLKSRSSTTVARPSINLCTRLVSLKDPNLATNSRTRTDKLRVSVTENGIKKKLSPNLRENSPSAKNPESTWSLPFGPLTLRQIQLPLFKSTRLTFLSWLVTTSGPFISLSKHK